MNFILESEHDGRFEKFFFFNNVNRVVIRIENKNDYLLDECDTSSGVSLPHHKDLFADFRQKESAARRLSHE